MNQRRGAICLLLSACVAASWPRPSAAQAPVTVDTPAGSCTFADGLLLEARNRLTGEAYSLGRAADRTTGLLWPGDRTLWVEGAAQRSHRAAGSEARWADGSTLTTTAEAPGDGEGAVVRQTGRGAAGLWACQWGISGLSDEKVSLIVPVWSGIRLERGSPFDEGVFDWPTSWEAQMVIIQGREGGLWVRADDRDDRFKALWIRHRAGVFDLGFRTCNEGPLASHTSVTSVAWRVGFYRGDWRVPARRFRDWMARSEGLSDPGRRPAWADGIRSVVILPTGPAPAQHEEARAVLKKLTDWVTPSKTLLYTFNWRRDPYDINYPDYTPHEGFPELVAFAHQLGYRVMPHTCYYGVNLENPEYERLKQYHIRDALTGDLITYLWPPSKPVSRIAMIHPGAQAWRDLYVRRCKEAVERTGADAFHLDCTLVMPNVTERADGLNTIQGNVAFHRDLRAALPGVALGGEGLNEVSCRREAFAQVHGAFAVGMDPSTLARVANEAGVDCSHPISAYLLSPFTRWYGYLGYPAPEASALYRGWTRAYESWGVAPTLASPTLAALEHPSPDLRVRLEEMRLVDRYDLRPSFDAAATPRTKCLWRGPGGEQLVYERDGSGGTHAWWADATGIRRTVYRYLRGRTTFAGPGSVGPWAAYDGAGVYGLDPDRTYLWEPRPPAPGAPHLLRLPEGLILHSLRCTDDALVFDLGARPAGFDLVSRLSEADLGLVVEGRDQPFGQRAIFAATRGASGGQSKPALFAHPPWDEAHGVVGAAYAQWTLRLPDTGKLALTFAFGLRDGAEKTDGVSFAVEVDGATLLRREWDRCQWLPCRVDLSAYAGRQVKLRLSVGKGPRGRGAYAWCLWGEPRIAVEPSPQPLRLEALTPRQVAAVAGPSPDAASALEGPEGALLRHRVQTRAPGATCLFFRRPPPTSLPLDLRTAPFTWTPVVDGMAIPAALRPAYLSGLAGEGTCAGVTRPALVTHPPVDGFTAIDYVLSLPPEPPTVLRFWAGIQDGAVGTNGVAFVPTVNGQAVSRLEVKGADGWHEAGVDLGAYAGRTILLSLIVDALGDASYDWARWGEPRLEPRR